MSNLHIKREMSTKDLTILSSEMDKSQKSKGIAFILWFFLGGFGGHRFYMGDIGYGIALAAATIIGGLLTLGLSLFVTGIWVLVDAFFISGRVDTINEMQEREIIANLGLARE
ncbi:TM2 domain-containing protein [Salinicoccus bachuensis]|uniref:TM2 domain-containing protein n=1 Tax=Salinicoccus bachuensis TaxID=3136731 RepID=A0ABZ3CHT0_9STAP